MNKVIIITGSYLFILLMNPFTSLGTDFGSLFKKVQESIGGSSGASQSEIVAGLKQALEIGTGNTVQALSKVNGYYNNPKLKIPLPESMQKIEKILRATGFNSQLDEFELSMNRAAEKAAPEAKALFVDAIKQMTFADAKQILDGPDNAATSYFQEKTTDKLQTLMKPIVQKSMEKVGVTQSYKSVSDKARTLPFAGNYLVDLDSYVTAKSIDGLFVRLAEEEAKIRNDPAARVTDLLKKVFR
jgi:Protein of unknown function (DUF4197)